MLLKIFLKMAIGDRIACDRKNEPKVVLFERAIADRVIHTNDTKNLITRYERGIHAAHAVQELQRFRRCPTRFPTSHAYELMRPERKLLILLPPQVGFEPTRPILQQDEGAAKSAQGSS